MEKVIFNNSRNLNIVGNLFQIDSEAIIILSHGFTSNKDSKGRFPKLAEVLNKSGFSVLTFDFSGCGESDNDKLCVSKEVDDLYCAIKYVKSKGYKKIGLYGHSLGTLITLKCFTTDIQAIALSGALTDAMKYNWEEHFSKDQINELNEKGYITEYINEESRKKVIIDKQILLDFELINQKELLKNVTCPVLIIHGNNDEEEKLLYERSKKAMTLLSKESKLEIIDGANHSFMNHLDILINLVNDWFIKYIK